MLLGGGPDIGDLHLCLDRLIGVGQQPAVQIRLRRIVVRRAFDDLALTVVHRLDIRGLRRRDAILGGRDRGHLPVDRGGVIAVPEQRQHPTDRQDQCGDRDGGKGPGHPPTGDRFGRLLRCEWRGWGQLTGASISFHPSSPVVVEFVTVYFVPSGPVISPAEAS